MSYFFSACTLRSNKENEKKIFIIYNPEDEKNPVFKKDMLISSSQYRLFVSETKKINTVYVTYETYKTDEYVDASTKSDVFEKNITEKKAVKISGGDFILDVKSKETKIFGGKKCNTRKKSKTGFFKKIVFIAGFLIVISTAVFGGMLIGIKYFSKTDNTVSKTQITDSVSTIDGMIIPSNNELNDNPDVQQITISIDRSYSSVPKEDIQLKGMVVNGVAEIEMPSFDRDDYFSHVPGYTFGFSTEKGSDKIEYYGGEKYKFTSDTKLYRVLVKYGGGSGTQEDPYIINYFDQLELLAEEKARGYFKQTCDIVFPNWASHTPIDTVNKLKANPDKEKFEYDGGGYNIANIDNPLFGKISGATIENVNIKNSSIKCTDYKYYGFIACEAYNYQYANKTDKKNYETGETVIRNCSVSKSGLHIGERDDDEKVVVSAHDVIAPDRIEYDDNGNPVTTTEDKNVQKTLNGDYAVGGIIGLGGQIESCYVYDVGIYCYLDKYYLYAGGIAGKPANVINSGVRTFLVDGNVFSSGGIVGSAAGSRRYNAMGEELPGYYGGNIQGCMSIDARIKSEYAAGGIVGEATTPAQNAVISNCYAFDSLLKAGTYNKDGKVIKEGFNGGIIGSDGQETNGHLIVNTVYPAEYKANGFVVKSKTDDSDRLAPQYAFYQDTILSVINKNSVSKNNPSEIFTGTYRIDDRIMLPASENDTGGKLPYPESLAAIIDKIMKSEEN